MTGPTYYTSTDRRCEQSAVEIEIITRLADLGIEVVPQVKFNTWVFDGAINGTQILVEIHGDYWHERPEVKERDARKVLWATQNNFAILVIWESKYRADPDGELLAFVETFEQLKAYTQSMQPAPVTDNAGKVGIFGMDRPRRSDYGDWRDAFIAALSESGIILDGCEAAGVSRETVRLHRRADPAFEETFQDARKEAADRLRREYQKRAQFQSDRAMEFLLKSLDPDEYTDRKTVDVNVTSHQATIDDLLKDK